MWGRYTAGGRIDASLDMLKDEGKLKLSEGNYILSDVYRTYFPIEGNKNIIQVEALLEYYPHLITWSPDTVARKGEILLDDDVIRITSAYLANMTDEEMMVVRSQIANVHMVHGINAIDSYKDCFIIHTQIMDKPYSMIVSVMNMMDEYFDLGECGSIQHLRRRWSLN